MGYYVGDFLSTFRGYAKRHTVSGLDPQTEYKYRLKFMNSAGNSEFSAHVKVSTTSKYKSYGQIK